MSSEMLIWAALCLPLLIAAGIAITGAFSNVREGVTLIGATILFGVVIALAMLATLASAALSGIVLPVLLERFNIDPALASGPFVTTVTDVVGFFAFLGLASVMLL